MLENLIWVEKYRPRRVSDCILPTELKATFQQWVDSGSFGSCIFSGGAGVGKTTVAKALCDELDCDYMMINGSNEGRLLDTLRNQITTYATSVSFSGKKKVVIIDEADFIPAETVQPALRNFIEEYSANCTFILTCNFKNRLMDAIHSRCPPIEFVIPAAEKPKLMVQMLKRAMAILEEQKIGYDKKTLAALIEKFFPDFRRILGELQRYSALGKIDTGILSVVGDESIANLVAALKKRQFAEVKKWVMTNPSLDLASICRKLDDALYHELLPQSIPQSILVMSEYQHRAVTAMDPYINTLACMIELMALDYKGN